MPQSGDLAFSGGPAAEREPAGDPGRAPEHFGASLDQELSLSPGFRGAVFAGGGLPPSATTQGCEESDRGAGASGGATAK